MLFSLIQKAAGRLFPKEEKSPAQEIDAFLARLRAASPDELGGFLAAALLAKKTLDTTRQVEQPFPAEVFEGRTAIDENARTQLASYARALKAFQAICAASGTILGVSTAKGLDTWIVSSHALADPLLGDRGREVWTLLKRGEADVEAAYGFMVRRDVTDVELGYLAYRPAALAAS